MDNQALEDETKRRLKRERRRTSEVPGVYRVLTAFIALGLVGLFEYILVTIWLHGDVRLVEPRPFVLGAEIFIYAVLGAVCLYSLQDTIRHRGGG